jgi:hypothetical protein
MQEAELHKELRLEKGAAVWVDDVILRAMK